MKYENPPPPNLVLGEKYYLGKGAFVDASVITRPRWFEVLLECLQKVKATDDCNEDIPIEEALSRLREFAKKSHDLGGKVMFFGNGGSAAIASHMATDWSKNGGFRSMAFNDGSMLTCLANDFGYENVFSKQIEYFGNENDIVVIISTSGRSVNVIETAKAARVARCNAIVTLTGMNPNNTLRRMGNLNFYINCVDYGLVEVSHMALLHSVVSVKS